MTVSIRLYEHPLAPVAAREFAAPCVGQWLLQHYGDVPTVNVQVYRGQPSAESDVSRDVQALLATEGDYTVLQAPGVAGFTAWQIIQAVLVAYSVASALFAKVPTQPANVNRTSASPNNSLGERTNQVRLLQRIEDIYGTVRAVPSLLMPTYNKYINHRKVEYGYYCVGRGYYAISNLRDADTALEDIPNASAAVYGPFTSPNSGHAPQLQVGAPIIDRVLTVARSEEVDGITLKALNQMQLARSAKYEFTRGGVSDKVAQDKKRPNVNAIVQPGDEIDISSSMTVKVAVMGAAGGFSGYFLDDSPGGDGGGGGGDDGGGSGDGGGDGGGDSGE